MARIAGKSTTKDTKGNPESITINLKKHPRAAELLKDMGLLERNNLQQEVEDNPTNFITLEELRQHGQQQIKRVWAKWKK